MAHHPNNIQQRKHNGSPHHIQTNMSSNPNNQNMLNANNNLGNLNGNALPALPGNDAGEYSPAQGMDFQNGGGLVTNPTFHTNYGGLNATKPGGDMAKDIMIRELQDTIQVIAQEPYVCMQSNAK
jgi:hypothetical protein